MVVCFVVVIMLVILLTNMKVYPSRTLEPDIPTETGADATVQQTQLFSKQPFARFSGWIALIALSSVLCILY